MTDLTSLSLAEARDGLGAKRFSAVELTRASIEAVEAARALNCFIVETPDHALAQAAASDARIAKGEAGVLEGIPLGIKDLYCTKGVQTTAASRILEGFVPPYESTVSANLWRDGATMLGKLNLDEFAMGSANETSHFGPVVSPWRRQGDTATKLVPGGSSGGSAAAVAARLCFGATATDTGGSIRQPAAFTGTVGIKPTYGRCSRWGIVAFASSLDQAGPDMVAWAALPAASRPDGLALPILADGALTEPEAKALFHAYGIPTPAERIVADPDSAVLATSDIGFPVVLKGVSRAVVHKSDLGLVRLALADAASVRAAARDILAVLSRVAPDEKPALAVQEMVRGRAELILGARAMIRNSARWCWPASAACWWNWCRTCRWPPPR